RRRGTTGDCGHRGRDGPADGRSRPLRRGPPLARGARRGRRAALGGARPAGARRLMAVGVAPSKTPALRHEVLRLGLRDPFRIARSDHDAGHAVTTVVVELTDPRFPGIVGLGEGYPDRFYGELIETMAAVFPMLIAALGQLDATPDGLAGAGERLAGAIRWNGAAKCAVDIALHDLVGKASERPVHDL